MSLKISFGFLMYLRQINDAVFYSNKYILFMNNEYMHVTKYIFVVDFKEVNNLN